MNTEEMCRLGQYEPEILDICVRVAIDEGPWPPIAEVNFVGVWYEGAVTYGSVDGRAAVAVADAEGVWVTILGPCPATLPPTADEWWD